MCILDWVCRKRKRGAEKSKPIRKPLKFQNLRLTLSFFFFFWWFWILVFIRVFISLKLILG